MGRPTKSHPAPPAAPWLSPAPPPAPPTTARDVALAGLGRVLRISQQVSEPEILREAIAQLQARRLDATRRWKTPGDQFGRIRELLKLGDRTPAEAVLDAAANDIRAAFEREEAERPGMHDRYFSDDAIRRQDFETQQARRNALPGW